MFVLQGETKPTTFALCQENQDVRCYLFASEISSTIQAAVVNS